MYIHAFGASWMNNPFWRKRLLIATDADLQLLFDSGIESVVIDDSRGLGISTSDPSTSDEPSSIVGTAVAWPVDGGPAEPAALSAPDPLLPYPTSSDGSAPARRRSILTEVDRAQDAVDRSKAAVTRMFGEARLGHAIQLDDVAPLVEEIAASVSRDPSAMVKVTRLKTKNEYTYLHSVAVCALMINLARHLGLPEDQVSAIGMAGLLHDIGKMAMPTEVLDKPGALDAGEMQIIRNHPVEGHALLVDSPEITALALDVCLHHHERIDGNGYPFGIRGEDLSIYARMGAICDVYDAVTSNRPYKTAWSPSEALAKMLEWEGHFDPEVLDAFITSIGILPLGALVRLKSSRLGLVVAGNDHEPTLPVVRAFYDIPGQRFVDRELVGTSAATGGDPILKREHGDYWFGENWPGIRDAIRADTAHAPNDYTPARPYVSLSSRRRLWPFATVAKADTADIVAKADTADTVAKTDTADIAAHPAPAVAASGGR